MDLNLFRKALASKQGILTEAHRGIKNDYSLMSYARLETAKNLTGNEVSQIKSTLSSVSGVYGIHVTKELNNSISLSYLDVDSKLPFVVSLRLYVYRGPKNVDPKKTYEVTYAYYLVPRKYATPQYLKTHYPTYDRMVATGEPISVFIEDLKSLDPFQKSYIRSNLSKWKNTFNKSKLNENTLIP
jgi:hypothetical protein